MKEKIAAAVEVAFKPRVEGIVQSMQEAEVGTRGRGLAGESPSVPVPVVSGEGIDVTMPSSEEPPPLMPVRRLQNYAFCPRQFYFQWVENVFLENADTVEGSAVHRQVDKPSALPEDPKELELPEGARLRSLQLESETLGLVGKIDVCEGTGEGIEVSAR